MRKQWMAAGDDPHYVACPVLLRVTEMADFDEGLALQAVGMTFLDTLDWGDAAESGFLSNLLSPTPRG